MCSCSTRQRDSHLSFPACRGSFASRLRDPPRHDPREQQAGHASTTSCAAGFWDSSPTSRREYRLGRSRLGAHDEPLPSRWSRSATSGSQRGMHAVRTSTWRCRRTAVRARSTTAAATATGTSRSRTSARCDDCIRYVDVEPGPGRASSTIRGSHAGRATARARGSSTDLTRRWRSTGCSRSSAASSAFAALVDSGRELR